MTFLSSSTEPRHPIPAARLLDFRVGGGNHLSPEEVHLCLVSLRADEKDLAVCFDVLTPEEQLRTQKYLSVTARHDFLVSRAVLRGLIRAYCPQLPLNFAISVGPFGKPYVALAEMEVPLFFNVSHSGHIALLGFSLEREIGVDIEEVRDIKGLVGIARTVFSERETEFFHSISDLERRALFFRLWTCKEALLKEEGTGFHRDPRSICLFSEIEHLDQNRRVLEFKGRFIQSVTHPLGFAFAWALRSTESPILRWIEG